MHCADDISWHQTFSRWCNCAPLAFTARALDHDEQQASLAIGCNFTGLRVTQTRRHLIRATRGLSTSPTLAKRACRARATVVTTLFGIHTLVSHVSATTSAPPCHASTHPRRHHRRHHQHHRFHPCRSAHPHPLTWTYCPSLTWVASTTMVLELRTSRLFATSNSSPLSTRTHAQHRL
jgi:hypothetical protein